MDCCVVKKPSPFCIMLTILCCHLLSFVSVLSEGHSGQPFPLQNWCTQPAVRHCDKISSKEAAMRTGKCHARQGWLFPGARSSMWLGFDVCWIRPRRAISSSMLFPDQGDAAGKLNKMPLENPQAGQEGNNTPLLNPSQ